MDLNKFFTGMASLAAAMALTACSQDEADIQPSALTQGNVISLTSQVAATRAASDPQTTALSTSNKVGVYVTGSSSTLYNNVEHSVGDAGALTATTTMNYPTEDGATVNIYAYAPYASSLELSSDNAFSVSTDQSAESGYLASDLVYASKTGQASTSDVVSLTFAHKLSQLQIIVQKDDAIDISGGVTVYLTGTNTAATFNPTTGAVAAATTANVQDIKVATITEVGTVYAIAVPQDIAANTELVKITTSDKTYKAKLTTATSLTGGKAYSFTVKLVASSSSVVEVPVSLTATSITEWGTPTSLGSANMEEVVSYEVGDFILKDGSLVKNASLTDAQKSDVVAVIFSTSPSTTDSEAGYAGYAMGVKRIGASGGTKKQWYVNTSYGLGADNLADGFADMDGLTKNTQIKANSTYTGLSTNTEHIANLENYSLTIESSATNLSGWFTPSFGQLIAILNNLGEAGITSSIASEFKNNSSFYVNSTATPGITISDVFNKINAYMAKVGQGDIVTVGNIDLGTVTENTSSQAEGKKFWMFAVKSSGDWELTAAQAKVGSAGVKEVSVIPCIAYKLP